MPDRESKYESIEQVRSILYPRRPALLNLRKGDVLEFPVRLTGESPDAAWWPENRCNR